MWHLYLDESGDLGFDFVNKKPSKFFTVTILAISSPTINRKIRKEIQITIRRKLNKPHKRKRMVQELKGTSTTFEIKKFFYHRISDLKFGIYSITLNKRKLYEKLTRNKSHVYNWVSRLVLDTIPFENNNGERVELILDKCMGKPEIREFNEYIRGSLESRLPPSTILDFVHRNSHNDPGLQAVDLFCWGIFQKYERKNEEWYLLFQEKVKFDQQYL